MYSDIEPMPKASPAPSITPVLIALLLGVAASFAIDLPTGTEWGLLAYLPWAVLISRHLFLLLHGYKRYMRDLDGWSERMEAYYGRRLS